MKLILFLLIFSLSSFAKVKVAFIKVFKPNGRVLYLEPNFPYSHVAISYRDGWINAHPKYGVQLTRTLAELDFPKHTSFIIESSAYPQVTTKQAQAMQGYSYDRQFNWRSNRSLYCSELVAKLLSIKPVPMYFDPKIWPKQYEKLNGRPGISPFLLLKKMLDLGFVPASRSSF